MDEGWFVAPAWLILKQVLALFAEVSLTPEVRDLARYDPHPVVLANRAQWSYMLSMKTACHRKPGHNGRDSRGYRRAGKVVIYSELAQCSIERGTAV
jgi:hypothetical protein